MSIQSKYMTIFQGEDSERIFATRSEDDHSLSVFIQMGALASIGPFADGSTHTRTLTKSVRKKGLADFFKETPDAFRAIVCKDSFTATGVKIAESDYCMDGIRSFVKDIRDEASIDVILVEIPKQFTMDEEDTFIVIALEYTADEDGEESDDVDDVPELPSWWE